MQNIRSCAEASVRKSSLISGRVRSRICFSKTNEDIGLHNLTCSGKNRKQTRASTLGSADAMARETWFVQLCVLEYHQEYTNFWRRSRSLGNTRCYRALRSIYHISALPYLVREVPNRIRKLPTQCNLLGAGAVPDLIQSGVWISLLSRICSWMHLSGSAE